MSDGFDPGKAGTWDERQRAVYETGYREGGNSTDADWHMALDEVGVGDSSPDSVAEYIALVRDTVRVYTSEYHGCDRRECSCGAYTALRNLLDPKDPQ